MLFVTRQPVNVMNYLIQTQKDYYAPAFSKYTNGEGVSNLPIEKLFGYTPIFVSSIESDEDLIFTAITSSPSVIECYIVFETEDFDVISLSKWLDYLKHRDVNVNLSLQKGEEPEYVVKKICYHQIRKIIPVAGAFNKGQDFSYLLSDNFYKQTPLFNKTGRAIGSFCESRVNELNKITEDFLKIAINDNYKKALNNLRKDLRDLLS